MKNRTVNMNEASDYKGHIVFNEGFCVYWNDDGIEIRVTDYKAKSLKLSKQILKDLLMRIDTTK